MGNRYLNQRMRAVLYGLKRDYGGRIDLYKKGAVTSNAKTGERTVAKSVTVINRAIILPADVARREVRGISLISANKTMVMGGGYDSSIRVFIIERRDAPDISLSKDDWIVFEGKKYEVHSFDDFEFDTCWVITAKALLGETPEQIHLLSADSLMDLSSELATE